MNIAIDNNGNFAAPPRGPVDAIRTCLVKFFDFRGRASRSEFWWFFALFLVVWQLPTIVYIGFLDMLPDSALITALAAIFFFNNLIIRVPLWAVAVRRLHDINFRGWWILPDVIHQSVYIVPTIYMLHRTGGFIFGSGETAHDTWFRLIFEPAVLSLPPTIALAIANTLITSVWAYYATVILALCLCLIKGKAQRNRFDRGGESHELSINQQPAQSGRRNQPCQTTRNN